MTVRTALPRNLTSYDILKTAAVVFMIVDHVGYYFEDGQNWYRVIGRLCVPIWFFLIGYARTRELEPRLWIGAAIMEVGRFAAGMPILAVTILGTFLLARRCIDPAMRVTLASERNFWLVNALLFIFALPSFYVFEYGTLGLLLAMFGWMARARQDGNPLATEQRLHQQMTCSAASFVIWQTMTFAFGQLEMMALSAGTLAIAALLLFFRAREFSGWNGPVLMPLKALLQFCGRWTLEIYVAHVIAFQTIASIVDPHRFPAFHLQLFIAG